MAAAVAAAFATLIAGPAIPAGAREPMTITSPAFANDEPIPDGFACDGANASPPLRFHHVPAKTKELALIVTDPDAPVGTIVHWVAWHLPRRGVPEQKLPTSVHQGKNTRGVPAWSGPCPPVGSDPHHYIFTLSALRQPVGLPDGATVDQLRQAMRGTVITRARLIGTYQRV
jgi:Raf kinase inhibitor-like YbhB/YbcL family protein